jgi:hypothetical protein
MLDQGLLKEQKSGDIGKALGAGVKGDEGWQRVRGEGCGVSGEGLGMGRAIETWLRVESRGLRVEG